MRRADSTEQIIKQSLSFAASPAMHDRILNDVLAAQSARGSLTGKESQKIGSALAKPNIRSIIMKSPITKFATAAIVAIACLIGLSLWRGTESGIALADVLAQIEKVKAVEFKGTWKTTSGDPNNPYNIEQRVTSLDSREYGTKSICEALDPNGGWSPLSENYDLTQEKIRIIIYPTNKIYMRQELKNASVEEIQAESFARDPLRLLKEILKTKYESLGRSIVDGVEVEVFRITDPNCWEGKNPKTDIKLWVDVKTLLPVRYDLLTSSYDGEDWITHLLLYDFQWDVSVDASEFEPPPIPDGYKIQDNFPDLANEEIAIQGLKQCVELLGNYPERIALSYLWSRVEKSETSAALRLKEELKGLTGFDRDQKKMGSLKPMRLLNKFYRERASNDSAYYGKTVTPKDADKVLMRWKVSDNEYRVIYGDLHTETVTQAKLAELEKALPK